MDINGNAGRNKYQMNKRQSASFLSGLRLMQCLAFILLILCIVILYAILFSGHGIIRYRQQSGQVAELETKVDKLQVENQKLYHKIQSLKRDPLARERLVRDQLGWVRGDEIEFEFAPPKKDSQ
jgi:cell division protein FtsB